MEIIVPTQEQVAEIEIIHDGQARELVEAANMFEIKNDTDLGRAADLTNKVNAVFKEIDEQRDGYARPLFESNRFINGHFKALLNPLEAAEKRILKLMTDYRRHLNMLQEQEAQRIRKEQAKKEREAKKAGEPPPAPPPPPQEKPVTGDLGGKTKYKPKWVHEVVDITEVPLRLLMVNDGMIKQAIKDGKRGNDIPGINIYDEGSMKTR